MHISTNNYYIVVSDEIEGHVGKQEGMYQRRGGPERCEAWISGGWEKLWQYRGNRDQP